MTVKELSKLYWLNREIEWSQKELSNLQLELERDKAILSSLRISLDGMVSPKLDGMPHGSDVSSPVENTVEQIMKLEEALRRKHDAMVNLTARIAARKTLAILERDNLERYINTIDDPYMKDIFRLRFINGLPWQQVAASLGRIDAWKSVKDNCYRYLKMH